MREDIAFVGSGFRVRLHINAAAASTAAAEAGAGGLGQRVPGILRRLSNTQPSGCI